MHFRRGRLLRTALIALALAMFAPSKASAGGYWAGYGYGCCCVTYCYGAVRGGYAYPRYGSRRYGYGRRYSRYGYPRARGYARRQLRREAIRDW